MFSIFLFFSVLNHPPSFIFFFILYVHSPFKDDEMLFYIYENFICGSVFIWREEVNEVSFNGVAMA